MKNSKQALRAEQFGTRINVLKSIWKLNYLIDCIKIINTYLLCFLHCW